MSDRTLIESIRQIAGTYNRDNVHYIVAEVDSVDIDNRLCTVTTISGAESITIENVKLMPCVDDGVLLVPTVGSNVFVITSDYNQPFVAMVSEIDGAIITSGDGQIIIQNGLISIVQNNLSIAFQNGKIQLNDGSYGGLVEVINLVTKLNNLENLVNDLISKYNIHTHILTLSTGTGTAAPTTTIETGTLTPTQRSDIENTIITHGK